MSGTSSGIAYNTTGPNGWIANGSNLWNNRLSQGTLDNMHSSNTSYGTYGYADWGSGNKNSVTNNDDDSIFATAGAIALTAAAVDGPLPVGDIIGGIVLAGATVYDATQRTFVTYTMTNGLGQTYVGRTSGYGDPISIMNRRTSGHHMKARGFGNAVLDRAVQGYHGYPAIRGREQQLIDHYGGVGSPTVGNSIRGVSRYNPAGYLYHGASNLYFGPKAPYTGIKF